MSRMSWLSEASAGRQRVVAWLLLSPVCVYRAVLGHSRRHVSPQDRGAKGRGAQPGDGSDPHPRTAIAVPVAAGFILNYVGYEVPFFIACGFAVITFFITLRSIRSGNVRPDESRWKKHGPRRWQAMG